MRLFFLRSSWFVLGLWVLALALNSLLMWGIHRKQTGDYGLWNRIVTGRVNARLLISGSSRVLVGVDSRRLGKATGLSCVSIAVDGSRLEAQVALLETYLCRNEAPAVIVQSVDMYSLEPLDKVYQPSLYAPYLKEPSLYAYARSIERGFWARRYLPLYNFAWDKVMLFESLWSLLGRESASWEHRYDGYRPNDAVWDGSFERFEEAHPEGRSYIFTSEGIGYLQRIFALANEHGARVILIYPPEFHRNMTLTLNRPEILKIYRDLATKNRAPFWDFSDEPICRDQTAFYNSQHLNRSGAERFTDVLAERVRNWMALSPSTLPEAP
jgi:hypothetical protein